MIEISQGFEGKTSKSRSNHYRHPYLLSRSRTSLGGPTFAAAAIHGLRKSYADGTILFVCVWQRLPFALCCVQICLLILIEFIARAGVVLH